MPTASANRQSAETVNRAIEHLRRHFGPPPTLRQLASEIGLPIQVDSVPKPLNGAAFRAAAAIAKPTSLDSPLIIAEQSRRLVESDEMLRFAIREASLKQPPPFTVKQLISKSGIVKGLQAPFAEAIRRRLDAGTIPDDLADAVREPLTKDQILARLTDQVHAGESVHLIGELVDNAGVNWDDKTTAQVIKSAAFKLHVIPLPTEKALSREWLVLDRSRVESAVETDALFDWAFDSTRARAKGATAFTTQEIAMRLPAKSKEMRLSFIKALLRRITEGRIPSGLGCLRVGVKPILFFLTDVQSQSPPGNGRSQVSETKPATASADLAARFAKAFDRCDAASGSRNFVKLLTLRQALPDLDRVTFDAELARLRRDWIYTLESSEGNVVTLTDAERDAGIVENGVPLVYISRR